MELLAQEQVSRSRNAIAAATLGLAVLSANSLTVSEASANISPAITNVAVEHDSQKPTANIAPSADIVHTAANPIEQPNVVWFVVDDLDKKLMRYMPNTRNLIADKGAEFPNYYVERSTCCTSRANMLSGKYAQNHGVLSNDYPSGGFVRWKQESESSAVPTWLAANGYENALMGKYFNQYPYPGTMNAPEDVKKAMMTYVPPGWKDWFSPVAGNAYAQVDYGMNDNGEVDPAPRDEYLDSVMGQRILRLISGEGGMGFDEGGKMIYYSSYSPHSPYAHPAKYDLQFKNVVYPQRPNFNEADVSDKFGVSRTKKLINSAGIARINEAFRDRIRSVQEFDKNVKRIVDLLRHQGTLDNTYMIFTSDNGYNMGEHRRESGKYNHFQETVNVPLYISGPGIPKNVTINDLASNIDLAPTVADMTDTAIPEDVDGISLMPPLTDSRRHLGRQFLLLGRGNIPLYHYQQAPTEEVPEEFVQSPENARKTDFNGVVSKRFKYINYSRTNNEEFYDLQNDPYELYNLLGDQPDPIKMTPRQQKALQVHRKELKRLMDCEATDCR